MKYIKTLTSFAGFALLFPVVVLAGDEAYETLDLTSHTVGDGLVFADAGEMLTDEQKEVVLDRRDKSCQKAHVRHRTKLVDGDLQPDVVRVCSA